MYRRLQALAWLGVAVLVIVSSVAVPPVAALSGSDIQSIQNNTAEYKANDTTSACSPDSVDANNPSSSTGDAQQTGFNFFVSKGLTDVQAAAIIGNFMQESHMNPHANQAGGPGIGIAQWSNPGRWSNPSAPNDPNTLTGFAQVVDNTKQYYSLGTQLDFVWYELQHHYATTLKNLQSQTAIEDATGYFMGTAAVKSPDQATSAFIANHGKVAGYENPGTPNLANRIKYAQAVLSNYGGTASGAVSGSGASCGSTGSVDCTGSGQAPATGGGLSGIRQQVVCLTEQELGLWDKGQMTPGFRSGSTTSFAKYSQNRDELWCADFASWIYNQAGDPLSSAPGGNVPLVDTIEQLGKNGGKFHFHAPGGYTPQPGDLVIHNPSHVNIVVSVNTNNSTVVLVGGDQSPTTPAGYPDGSRVSQYTVNGYGGNGIIGYVSPD